jgi:hypothetical protein
MEKARAWAENAEQTILAQEAPHRLLLAPLKPHEINGARLASEGLVATEAEISALPRFRLSCGVYFLFDGDEIVYVGQSTDVHSRVASHRLSWKQFDSYTYIPCRIDQLTELEGYYIKILQPQLNRAGL